MASKTEIKDALREVFAEKPSMKGKAEEVFGRHFNSRDDILNYGGLAWDQTRGLRDPPTPACPLRRSPT